MSHKPSEAFFGAQREVDTQEPEAGSQDEVMHAAVFGMHVLLFHSQTLVTRLQTTSWHLSGLTRVVGTVTALHVLEVALHTKLVQREVEEQGLGVRGCHTREATPVTLLI
jgi:hypothetical protein